MKKIVLMALFITLLLMAACANAPLKASDVVVSPDSGVALVADGTYRVGLDKAPFHIANSTQQQVTYGLYYQLERMIDGQWYVVPFKKDAAVQDISVLLEPGATNQENFRQDMHDYRFEEGRYRILKQVYLQPDGRALWLEGVFDMLPASQ